MDFPNAALSSTKTHIDKFVKNLLGFGQSRAGIDEVLEIRESLSVGNFFRGMIRVSRPMDGYLESPVPHLLVSNDSPSEEEADIILAAINGAMQKQEETLLAIDGLDELDPIIQRIRRFIIEHRKVMSPVRRLPAEILQTIFSEFISKEPRPLRHDPRLVLSHVSRYWRASAISYQALWAVLPFITLSKSVPNTKQIIVILTEFLRRSENIPLTVALTGGREQSSSSPTDYSKHPVFHLLIAHVKQWKRLILSTSAVTLKNLEPINHGLVNLESVSLDLDEFSTLWQAHDESEQPIIIDTFKGLQKLTHFSAKCNAHIRFRLSFLPLADLLATSPIITDSVSDLKVLPNLTKLVLDPHTLSEESVAWFNCVALPALEEVFFVSTNGSACRILSSIISRSSSPCRIKHLHIGTNEMDRRGYLPALLERTPALETLWTNTLWAYDVDTLASLDPESRLVPKLKQCSISIFHYDDDITTENLVPAILRLASSRCKPSLTDPEDDYIKFLEVTTKSKNREDLWWTTWGINQRKPSLQQRDFEGKAFLRTNSSSRSLEEWSKLLPGIIRNHFQCSSRSVDNGIYKWLGDIFTEIEGIQDFTPADIITTNIHQQLKKLSLLLVDRLPDLDDGHSAQINRIFQKWEAAFSISMHSLHWMYESDTDCPQSMVYIHPDHDIRAIPEKAARLFLQGYTKINLHELFDCFVDKDVDWNVVSDQLAPVL